ncbi:MAG: hypothetical protein M3537_07200, partial [Chloroflexota bacterium]|nr:hypothetical protein [Chloroflexota bacterium]
MRNRSDDKRSVRTSGALTALVTLSLLVGLTSAGIARAVSEPPLTNLAHLDFLGDTVTPPSQDGHTTYRLADEPSLRVLWTYAEPVAPGSEVYKRIGGGQYHPDTDTYNQGAFNTDDLTRAA